MNLLKLTKSLVGAKTIGDLNIEINDIVIDSSAVTKGSLFICITGRDFDGHNFIRQIELYGAKAIVTEKKVDTVLPQIIVKDSRKAMSILAGEFYGHADKRLKIIGVTGTNGKTTTTHIIKKMFDISDIECGLIGTLGAFYKDRHEETFLTTPDPLIFHRILKNMADCGVKVVVMEVSAHALALNKLDGIEFEAVVFTNFTQDHLDFFENMQNYKNAKLKLIKEHKCKYIVANADDSLGSEILEKHLGVITYGIENPSDVFALKVEQSKYGSKFILNLFDCVYNVNTKLIGKFNIYNLMASCAVCAILGIKTSQIERAIKQINGVEGRLEIVYKKGFYVYVDYAHTPDGLEKSILALKPLFNRLICVFGCGGNRDKQKREIMGEISGKYADFTVITSDNPRYEEPMEIISEVERGLLKVSKNYVAVQDRKEGIKYALDFACNGDAVLIAGKGSENYQEILGVKHVYNDKDAVKEILGGEEN